MALTPSSKIRTPQTHRRLNFTMTKPSPNPNSTAKDGQQQQAEHPVEVIGRIRDYRDRKEKPVSALHVNPDRHSLRVRTDIGYRDFSLDGVSLSEEEDLDGFYKRFVESRVQGVKLGVKCTIMMYGPTGSGKSHTMFGCVKQPGIVYRSMKDILGDNNGGNDGTDETVGVGTFVQVTVLEIYNEEIYDLLSTNNGGGFSIGWPKGSASKVKLEVMGKKAKNATFISGNQAGKISKEIQKVEKRRIVKSTLCNERSSRSHCVIIIDVPTVGGQLMLVDMAGSENIEQAGQNGLEAKMQTAKINQGNIALKRVVESIANGDSHVPFRDSKLTMLLQDSFEDDKSKILMILCANPDPKDMHRTLSTLEYGAKAKCIVRGPHTPVKEKGAEDSSSAVILVSRIAAMDQFIYKLQTENKLRENERNEANKELMKKEKEISALREKLVLVQGKGLETTEEEINLKVDQQTQKLKTELEKKIQECEKMANEFVEMEKKKMEQRIMQQQQEVELLRRRLEEIESELCRYRDDNGSTDIEGSSFAKRLLEIYADEDPGMEKSMDLVKSMDLDMGKRAAVPDVNHTSSSSEEEFSATCVPNLVNRAYLNTVFEEEEGDEEEKEQPIDEEVQKEVTEEKKVCSGPGVNFNTCSFAPSLDSIVTPDLFGRNPEKLDDARDGTEEKHMGSGLISEPENTKDAAVSRRKRIHNIFTLCGNYRELSQYNQTSVPAGKGSEVFEEVELDSKENRNPPNESSSNLELYVKWEASKENSRTLITTLKIPKDSTLADLRKLIDVHLGADQQAFTYLALGDPIPREKETTTQTSKLPTFNNQSNCFLACLRPVKKVQYPTHLPLSSLENKLPATPNSRLKHHAGCLSPEFGTVLEFYTLRHH